GFVDAGSDGRMDMMSAALGFAGLAAYLMLRERNPVTAALAGHALCAASVFTHPNGMFAAASLMFCTLWLDRRKMSVKFAGAIAAVIAIPGLRRHSGYRLLLWLAVLRFLMMSVGASWKLEYYLVHATPFYAAIAGIAGWWFWTRPQRSVRVAVVAALGAY